MEGYYDTLTNCYVVLVAGPFLFNSCQLGIRNIFYLEFAEKGASIEFGLPRHDACIDFFAVSIIFYAIVANVTSSLEPNLEFHARIIDRK